MADISEILMKENDLKTDLCSVKNIRNTCKNEEGKKEVKGKKETERRDQLNDATITRSSKAKIITKKELKVLCVFPRTVQVHFSLLPASSIGTTASTCSGNLGRFHIF